MNQRGRPAGHVTRPQLKVAAVVNARAASQRPKPTLGELVRQCGFAGRSNAKRALGMAKRNGLIDD